MNRGVHRFALLLAGATFFLIIAGALVTSHDAGLATSDWPLSNGQFFPRMVGNLFWEHGHRLVATTVGFLTVCFAVYLYWGQFCNWLYRNGWLRTKPVYRGEARRWVRRLGVIGLAVGIAHGPLGGLHVKL